MTMFGRRVSKTDLMEIPYTKDAIREALIAQRQYTLALYDDLPEEWWITRQFPFSELTNPPLWELAHIAWFAEFFCCRWQADDINGQGNKSVWPDADDYLNSSTVAHQRRWTLDYPPREKMFRYMDDALDRVLDALQAADESRVPLFQLALLHEDMHAEALLMTRRVLGLRLPQDKLDEVPRTPLAVPGPLGFAAGSVTLGASNQRFQFDNERPVQRVDVAAFEMDASVVSFDAFTDWRRRTGRVPEDNARHGAIAMHMKHADAEAYAGDLGRRLPTEAELEFAATQSDLFRASTGHVWEWTSTIFAPRVGFIAGPYRDYSVPWFPAACDATTAAFMVLKGGSFATHPRLKYPQYRNFYTADRRDMFCGFRTCRSL